MTVLVLDANGGADAGDAADDADDAGAGLAGADAGVLGAALGLGGTAGVDAEESGAAEGTADTDGPAGVDEAILCCPLAVQAAAATAIVRQPAACRTRALRRRPPNGLAVLSRSSTGSA